LPTAVAAAATLMAAFALLAANPLFAGVELHRTAPEAAGFDGGKLAAAASLYRDAVDRDDIRGVVLLVARGEKVVLHEAIGWRDKENRLPMEKDTLFRFASNTKAVVATGALILAERGALSLDDPVAKHIPGVNGDFSGITVAQLITHASGVPRGPIFLKDLHADSNLVREAERFARELKLETEPGTQFSYSNVGYNILGGVIEAASKQRLDYFLQGAIYEPLGMTDTFHHESVADPDRMAKVYTRKDGKWRTRWAPGDEASYPIVRASGGMIATAWDYTKFLQIWLNDGSAGSIRILSPDSVQAGRAIQSPTASYGYGWHVDEDGSIGHGGSDGTYAWVDPARQLIGLILTQSPRDDDLRKEFRDLVNAALLEEPAVRKSRN